MSAAFIDYGEPRREEVGSQKSAAFTDYGEPRMSDIRDLREELRDRRIGECGLRIGGTKCQRLHDIPLGDRCRIKGVCLTRLGEITGRA